MKLWDIFIFIFCLYMFNVIKYGNLKKKGIKIYSKNIINLFYILYCIFEIMQ